MRRLALCLAVAVAALITAPAAFADGGPFFVTQGGTGVANHDGRFHYVTVSDGTRTTILEKVEVAGGRVDSWLPLKGSWGTPIVGLADQIGQGLSRDGRTLVLASTSVPGSSSSRFLVIDTRQMRLLRTIVLRGSFSFDALSPNGSRMYLIQYTYGRSGDLTDYVVRAYDLRTYRLLPGKIAARNEDEAGMAGTPMTRTTSAGGRWVYTLYQKPSGEPFVHALDTVRGVAYCIDLPRNRALYNIVLSLRDGGRTLAVRWRSGRPWLDVAVGSWRISHPTGGFPWPWVGAAIGAGLALLVVGGGLLLRRRRREELEQHAGQELGLA
jgi:LPXTG-motif cell wall-anchored protein